MEQMCSTPTLVVSGGGGAFLHPTHCLGEEDLQNVAGTGGRKYTRSAEYPSSEISEGLSWLNLTKFRARNWRFDVIGGLIYLALAHSLFTDCSVEQAHSGNVKDASALYILRSWFQDTSSAMKLMITGSKLSFFVLLSLYMGRGDEVINLEDAKIIYNQFSRLLSPSQIAHTIALSHPPYTECDSRPAFSGKQIPHTRSIKCIIGLLTSTKTCNNIKSPAAYVYTTYMKICPIL